MLVKYWINGLMSGADEPLGFHCEYDDQKPLTLGALKRIFPESGEYHFRAKQGNSNAYVWLDLCNDAAKVPSFQGDVCVKALAINIPDEEEQPHPPVQHTTRQTVPASASPAVASPHLDVSGFQNSSPTVRMKALSIEEEDAEESSSEEDSDTSGYSSDSESDNEENASNDERSDRAAVFRDDNEEHLRREFEERRRKERAARESSSASGFSSGGDIFKKFSKSSFGGFIKASAKAAMDLASDLSVNGTGTLPSSGQMRVLNKLHKDLSTPFSQRDDLHQMLLEQLWDRSFPDEPYSANDSKWVSVGSSGSDPLPDVRGAGVLGLASLVYFADKYNRKYLRLIRSGDSSFPVLAVSMSVTRALCKLVKIEGKQFEEAYKPYWKLFSSEVSFYELFCYLMRMSYAFWQESGKRSADFGKVLDKACSQLNNCLQEGPTSLEHLEHIVSSMGVVML